MPEVLKTAVGELTEAQETLLIPLWARAQDARSPAPILHDKRAVELVDSLEYDFGKFQRLRVDVSGFCLRAAIFDHLVRKFLDQHPRGTIVEIGPGLDTRMDRLDNGQSQWIEVDLPGSMSVRKRFFPEAPRRTQIASSALDPQWLDTVDAATVDAATAEPTLFLAEGVFHYFVKDDLKLLFARLAQRFTGAQLLFDCQSPFYGWYASIWHPVRQAPFRLAIRNIREIEAWDPRLRIELSIGFGDSPYYDQHFQRIPALHRWARRLLPPIRNLFRINLVRFMEARESRVR